MTAQLQQKSRFRPLQSTQSVSNPQAREIRKTKTRKPTIKNVGHQVEQHVGPRFCSLVNGRMIQRPFRFVRRFPPSFLMPNFFPSPASTSFSPSESPSFFSSESDSFASPVGPVCFVIPVLMVPLGFRIRMILLADTTDEVQRLAPRRCSFGWPSR